MGARALCFAPVQVSQRERAQGAKGAEVLPRASLEGPCWLQDQPLVLYRAERSKQCPPQVTGTQGPGRCLLSLCCCCSLVFIVFSPYPHTLLLCLPGRNPQQPSHPFRGCSSPRVTVTYRTRSPGCQFPAGSICPRIRLPGGERAVPLPLPPGPAGEEEVALSYPRVAHSEGPLAAMLLEPQGQLSWGCPLSICHAKGPLPSPHPHHRGPGRVCRRRSFLRPTLLSLSFSRSVSPVPENLGTGP